MKSTLTKGFLIAALLCSGTSQATIWTVTDVLSGSDGGFGFSSLHRADEGSPMSGATIAAVDSASGTYNDVSGVLNLTLGLSNADTLEIIGTLVFDGSGNLDGDSQVAYSGLTNLATTWGGIGVTAAGSLGYMDGDVCCGGSFDPNSFSPTGVGDLHYMTLWGADFAAANFIGDYTGSSFGMDMRLELSQVPVPAAVYLFGTALLGLFGFNRRKSKA
jgi:hypothetical protein